MVKRQNWYTSSDTGRIIVVFLFLGTVILTLSYTLVHNLYHINTLKKELELLEEKKLFLLEQEDAIEADIKKLSDPLYIARYAREKYFYSRDGEIILRFEK